MICKHDFVYIDNKMIKWIILNDLNEDHELILWVFRLKKVEVVVVSRFFETGIGRNELWSSILG